MGFSFECFFYLLSDTKQNKGSILKASVDYIKQLKQNADEYKKAEETNKYLNLLNNKLFNRIKELEFLCRINGIPTLTKNENSSEYYGNPPMQYSIPQQQQSISDTLIHSNENSTEEKKLIEFKVEPMNDEPTLPQTSTDEFNKIDKKIIIKQNKSYDSLSTSPSPNSSSSASISSNSETNYFQTSNIKLITTSNKKNEEPTLTTLNSPNSQQELHKQQSIPEHQTSDETFL